MEWGLALERLAVIALVFEVWAVVQVVLVALLHLGKARQQPEECA